MEEIKTQNKQALMSHMLPHEMSVFEMALKRPFFIYHGHKKSINSGPRNINYASDGDCI